MRGVDGSSDRRSDGASGDPHDSDAWSWQLALGVRLVVA